MKSLDCSLIKTQNEFWNEYLNVVDTEGAEYFGRNLDAFWDALSAGGPGHPKDLSELSLTNSNALKTIDAGAFHTKLASLAQDLLACNHSDFVLQLE